eukprot:TRINITY_DN10774_c0_g1_i1.p2 TRINITY_DN10774_c0_g1~~TRINITY_DN10774_c0_g1_i1.p2  ORF type:complete len:377 (+),score=134.15 TRINITY_DN10774_c0_g1_i1:125-1132(+)
MSLPASMRAVVAEAGRLVTVQRPLPTPSAGEVLVRVHATAINRADTLQRKGQYPVPPGATDVLGLEMAGTVVRPGSRWGAGDRVMALLSGGGYADYVSVPEELLMRIPQGYNLHQAAAIPETWLTAFQLLFLVGGARSGETALVHAAGSGVGTAATQLATAHGIKVIATAGAPEKLEVAAKLGAVACFNYKEGPWAGKVKEATEGKGVNIVLDPVGGSYWEQNSDAIALDGRWVLYGLMGGVKVEGPILAHLLRKRARLEGTTLRSRSLEYRAELTRRFAEHALEKFDRREYNAVLDPRSFTLEEAQAAHEYMESNANIGKIVVKIAEEDVAGKL